MGDVIINQGKTNTLVITLPAKGDVDWASKVRQAFQDLCDHDHTGGIKGKKITGDALADNTITINNIDLSSVNLNTFLNIQEGTNVPSGSVLLWSEENQEWYPSTIQNVNSSSNVYVITNDTDLNGYDPTPGDVLYVDSQGQSNPFTNGVSGAADFSHYNKNLKGVKIISQHPLVMDELDECKIMGISNVTLSNSVNNSEVRSTQNITIQSHFNNSQANSGAYNIILDGSIVQNSSLQGTQLQDTSTTNNINFSQGFFNQINLTSASTTIATNSKIEAASGIVSLSGTPSFSGTTSKPVTIVNQEVRTQVLPETAIANDILKYDGSSWVADSDVSDLITIDIDNELDTIYAQDAGNANYPSVLTRKGTGSYEFQHHGAHVFYKTWTINIPSRSTSSLQTYSVQISPASGIGSNGHAQFDHMSYDINDGIVSAGLIRYSNNHGGTSTSQNYPIQHIPLIKCTNNAFWNHNEGYTVPTMIDIGLGLGEMPVVTELNQTSTSSFSTSGGQDYSPNLSLIRFTHSERVYLHIATKYLEDPDASATITLTFRIVKFSGDYAAVTSSHTV